MILTLNNSGCNCYKLQKHQSEHILFHDLNVCMSLFLDPKSQKLAEVFDLRNAGC
jgi:hypothetical protein